MLNEELDEYEYSKKFDLNQKKELSHQVRKQMESPTDSNADFFAHALTRGPLMGDQTKELKY